MNDHDQNGAPPDRRTGDRRRDNRRQDDRRFRDRRDNDMPVALEWSEKFATGIRAIDNDHQELFVQFKALTEQLDGVPDPRNLEWIIEGLKVFVTEHFTREEMFMENARYPDLEEHRKQHRRAAELIFELERIYRNDPTSIDSKKVGKFLGQWLTGHILTADMRYVPYLRGEIAVDGGAGDVAGDVAGEAPAVSAELEQLEFRLPPHAAEAVRAFVEILVEGGHIAAALAEGVHQLSEKRAAKVHGSAVQLFCKDRD